MDLAGYKLTFYGENKMIEKLSLWWVTILLLPILLLHLLHRRLLLPILPSFFTSPSALGIFR